MPRILSSASNLCSHWRRFPRDCASCRIGPQYALEAERTRAARAICHDVLWAKVIKARQVATAHGALQFLTLRHKICVWEDCDQFRPKFSVKGQDLSPGLERPANVKQTLCQTLETPDLVADAHYASANLPKRTARIPSCANLFEQSGPIIRVS